MNFEDILKQQELERQQRESGAKKLEEFIKKILAKENNSNYNSFIDLLADMDYSQFISHIERINGILKETPIKERESFKNDSAVVNSFMMSDSAEIVPPKKEIRTQIMEESFEKLKLLASSDDREKKDRVPFLVFNSIVYLHPFGDGNGRTARVIYKLLATEDFNDVLSKLNAGIKDRSKDLDEYHDNVNMCLFDAMLDEKKIDWMNNGPEEKSTWPYLEDDDPGVGFDKTYLGFLSAYNIMTDDEKGKYLKIGDHNAHSIDISEAPVDLIVRIKKEKEKIREEFTRKVIDLSFEPEGYFKELEKNLKLALS